MSFAFLDVLSCQFAKKNLRDLVTLGFALGCSEFIMLGVEPDMANVLGAPLSAVDDLVGRFAFVYAICTPVLGLTTGHFRRFSLLIAYLMVSNLGNLLAGVAASAFLTAVGVATIISNLSSGVIASRFGMESLAAGDKVALRGPAGQPTPATVVRVTPSKIVADADHELAGKALNFEIGLVEVEG